MCVEKPKAPPKKQPEAVKSSTSDSDDRFYESPLLRPEQKQKSEVNPESIHIGKRFLY